MKIARVNIYDMHPISVHVIYPYNLPFIVFYNKQGYNNLTNWNIGNTSIEIVKNYM